MNRYLCKFFSKLDIGVNLKNGVFFTFFAFVNNGINFILLLILAKYLNPDSYGYLNLFNTSVTIISLLIPLGSNTYIAVSYFRDSKDEFKKKINGVITISFTMFIIIFLFFSFLSIFINNIAGLSYEYHLIALLICFFQVFNILNLDLWRLKEDPIRYGIYTLGIVFLNFVLTIIFIVSLGYDWEGRVLAQFVVGIIFFIVSFLFLIRNKLFNIRSINIDTFKELLTFGLPLLPHQLSAWIKQGMDRYIINSFWGAGSVGVFSFAINISNIINMVGMAFNAANSVFLYKTLSKTEDIDLIQNKLKKQTKLMIIFFFFFFLLVFIISYFLIPFAFEKYIQTLPMLFPLCLAAFFQCIYYLFVNYLFFYKKTKILMYCTTSISLIHLALSYSLTRYSTIYTVYITLFTSFLVCSLVVYYSQKLYPLFMKRSN